MMTRRRWKMEDGRWSTGKTVSRATLTVHAFAALLHTARAIPVCSTVRLGGAVLVVGSSAPTVPRVRFKARITLPNTPGGLLDRCLEQLAGIQLAVRFGAIPRDAVQLASHCAWLTAVAVLRFDDSQVEAVADPRRIADRRRGAPIEDAPS
jgi:hypothetical protein